MQNSLRFGKILRNHIAVQRSLYHKFNISNFDEYFTKYYNKYKESITHRKHHVNLEQLLQDYKKYSNIVLDIKRVERDREAIAAQMRIFGTQKDSAAANDIMEQGRMIRKQLKDLMTAESDSKKELLPLMKTLPALLNPNTPQEDRILYESGPQNIGKNHLELCGPQIKLRQYSLDNEEPFVVAYMSGDLATLEIDLYFKLLEQFNQLKAYYHLKHPDMIKEFVAEACLENNEKALKILQSPRDDEDCRLILSGSSLPGFLAYISTYNIQSTKRPSKFYSMGRNYKSGGSMNHGLYELSQTIQAELFSITVDNAVSQASFEEEKDFILDIYKNLELPFKMVEVSAKDLLPNESRRIDFYIWSAGFGQHFKCGYLRSLEDHISRKLSMFNTNADCFYKMNHSIVFKLPTIMAATIEQQQKIISKSLFGSKQPE